MEIHTSYLIDISDEQRECLPCEERERHHVHADYDFDGEPWCKECFRGADARTGRLPDRYPHEVATRLNKWKQ